MEKKKHFKMDIKYVREKDREKKDYIISMTKKKERQREENSMNKNKNKKKERD